MRETLRGWENGKKKMAGHSGCEVYLMKEQEVFVRKISANLQYNSRLENQMKKQQSFHSSIIKKPAVFSHGYNCDGLFYFDMEYIKGTSFFEYVQKQSIDSAKTKFQAILDYICESNEISEDIALDITNKVDSLKLHPRFDVYKEYCLDFTWNKINKSYCHGDLTFENIIISNEQIYFIDFLDSFTDTKLIDYSKIFQELYTFWSFRNKNKKFNIKYVILDEMVALSLLHRQATIRLLILNLLRIIPYSKQKGCDFLDEQIRYILDSKNE